MRLTKAIGPVLLGAILLSLATVSGTAYRSQPTRELTECERRMEAIQRAKKSHRAMLGEYALAEPRLSDLVGAERLDRTRQKVGESDVPTWALGCPDDNTPHAIGALDEPVSCPRHGSFTR